MTEAATVMVTHEFDPAIIQPWIIEDAQLHHDTMRQTMELVKFTSESGQHFSGLDLNRHAPAHNPVVVLIGQYLGRSANPERKYEGYQYAAAFPDNRIVLLDLPGHGQSDRATDVQRREIMQHAGVSDLAATMASAAWRRTPDSDKVFVVGDSFGGRIAPDYAIQAGRIGLEPVALAGHEITGTDKRSVAGLMSAFFLQEWWAQRDYRSSRDGHHLNVAYESFRTELKSRFGYKDEDYKLYDIYRNDPAFIYALLRRSPMATADSFTAIEQLVSQHPNIQIAIASAALSKVSRLPHILNSARQIVSQYPANVQWEIWPQDSHSMGLAPEQPRLAAHTRKRLGHLASAIN